MYCFQDYMINKIRRSCPQLFLFFAEGNDLHCICWWCCRSGKDTKDSFMYRWESMPILLHVTTGHLSVGHLIFIELQINTCCFQRPIWCTYWCNCVSGTIKDAEKVSSKWKPEPSVWGSMCDEVIATAASYDQIFLHHNSSHCSLIHSRIFVFTSSSTLYCSLSHCIASCAISSSLLPSSNNYTSLLHLHLLLSLQSKKGMFILIVFLL